MQKLSSFGRGKNIWPKKSLNMWFLHKALQFLHATLDLTGKHCPVIFSAVLFFVLEKFSWTSPGGKCALHWFYCLEKQKFSLERTPPGKKLLFCIRYFWKMKEKPANLNRGVCFPLKWKATCKNWAHLDEEKIRPKKSPSTWFFHAALQLQVTISPQWLWSWFLKYNLVWTSSHSNGDSNKKLVWIPLKPRKSFSGYFAIA